MSETEKAMDMRSILILAIAEAILKMRVCDMRMDALKAAV